MNPSDVEPRDLDGLYERAAGVFSLLGAPTRLRILALLCRREMNVTQLTRAMGCAQPNVARDLTTLYRAGVLVRRRKGVHVFYEVNTSHGLFLCDAVRNMVGPTGQLQPGDGVGDEYGAT